MNDALVVKDVHKRYGDHEAVKGISFTVHEGEIFGLIGPNGAGKTPPSRTSTPSLRSGSIIMCIGR
ncbi:MAG: ATP-binding cassette domain-containing protein [Candidatus Methanomethylophilaceae archaeon]|nr:ATP-binding cassette domain-containing protein [Candidatus Methanomethylophilaceae archaeon]